KEGTQNGRGRGSTTFSVKTMTLKKTTLHDYISTNGEVEAQSSVEVLPDMAGRVASVEVQLGSSVSVGQVIAYIDPNEPGVRYVQNPVYAPINGSIVTTPLKVGTKVSTNSVLTTIGDIKHLQVTANIPERFVSLLKPGLTAHVMLESYPDVVFAAQVSRVSPVVDAMSRTKEIILTFDRNDARINAGMFAKVILYTVDYSGFVVMPVDSLVSKDDHYYAYVLQDDSTVQRREVTLGRTVDAVVQILDGLAEGESVVVEGQTALSDGAKVRDITNGGGQ
ncbi:MAG: efflux RND transporter periplasmic adaptor subunit, partial [Treponemataceae bacterium]|nr:efflux RND transporter periplasmic adaptor subunit [Treponemataceae bacterium]